MWCVLQRTTASGYVVPPSDYKPRIGHSSPGGDVTTVLHHSYWLRPKPKAGGTRGSWGTSAKAGVGLGWWEGIMGLHSKNGKRERWCQLTVIWWSRCWWRTDTWRRKRIKYDFCSNTAITSYFYHCTNLVVLQFGCHEESSWETLPWQNCLGTCLSSNDSLDSCK